MTWIGQMLSASVVKSECLLQSTRRLECQESPFSVCSRIIFASLISCLSDLGPHWDDLLKGQLWFTASIMVLCLWLEHECVPAPWPQIADVSVEVATVDHTLRNLYRRYRKSRRKPKGLQRLLAYLLNIRHLAIITAAVIFVVVVIVWSLLWVFICKYNRCFTVQRRYRIMSHCNKNVF